MPKLFLCDPEKKNYDIRKVLADSGVSDFEVIEEPDIEKVQERIKKEKPDFMIVGYAFNDADYDNATKIIKENTVPSVLLIYPHEKGLVREMRIRGIQTLYRDDIYKVGDMIKRRTAKE